MKKWSSNHSHTDALRSTMLQFRLSDLMVWLFKLKNAIL